MRITLVRSGGVAGMRREAHLDTAHLDRERAEEIRRLVEAAAVVAPQAAGASRRAADRFRYTLTVDDGRRRHDWTFDEEETPERLRPLLEAVRLAGNPDEPGSDQRST